MDSKVYQWPREGNETPMVGRKVQAAERGKQILITGNSHFGKVVLMLTLYGTVCEWVRESDLTEYVGGSGT